MAESDLQSTDWRLESLWNLGLLSAVFVHLHLTFSNYHNRTLIRRI